MCEAAVRLPVAVLINDRKPGGLQQQRCVLSVPPPPRSGAGSLTSVSVGPHGPVPSGFWWPQPCSFCPQLHTVPLFCLPQGHVSGGLGPVWVIRMTSSGDSLLNYTCERVHRFWVDVFLGGPSWVPAFREQVWLMAASPAKALPGVAPQPWAFWAQASREGRADSSPASWPPCHLRPRPLTQPPGHSP